ncbi:MAG: hypothetical protein ACI807_000976 [Paracoccaceae bacterium]|jgi:hypothetical protein
MIGLYRMVSALAVSAGFALFGQSSVARADALPIQVDMQLVLAVDISFSISRDEQDIQRRGYVAAFLDPEVIRAITSGYQGRIAVTYLEWAGEDIQFQVVPWMVISDPFSARAFSERLAQVHVNRRGRTSLSKALIAALGLLRQSPFVSNRMVVDISGDGFNNDGPRVDGARDALVYHGVTINGLPLMVGKDSGPEAMLDLYYKDCVIGGLGAFMMPMVGWDKFGATLNRKLIAEIAGPVNAPEEARVWHAVAEGNQPSADCLFGEKQERREYIRQLEDALGKTRAPRWIPREEDWPIPK